MAEKIFSTSGGPPEAYGICHICHMVNPALIVTTVRYQGNALTDTFNAKTVQCLTLLVHTSANS